MGDRLLMSSGFVSHLPRYRPRPTLGCGRDANLPWSAFRHKAVATGAQIRNWAVSCPGARSPQSGKFF